MSENSDFSNVYRTPALVKDFPNNDVLQKQLDALWNRGLDAANHTAIYQWCNTNYQ